MSAAGRQDNVDVGRLRLLAILRIAWAPAWLLCVAYWGANYLWVTDVLPDAAWVPVASGYFLPSPPSGLYASILWLASVVSTILVGIGLWTRVSSAVALATGFLLGPVAMGWGVLGHASQPILLMLMVFMFTPWAAVWSVDARRKVGQPLPVPSDRPYRVFMLLTGLLYLSSGVLKIYKGHFLQHGNLAGYLTRQNLRYADWYGVPTPEWSRTASDWVAAHPDLADWMGIGALVLELTILVGVLGPRFRVLACAMALMLQGGIGMLSPLRFYMQSHVALLLGGATLVLLLRGRSARLGRWFPALPPPPPSGAPQRQPKETPWTAAILPAGLFLGFLALAYVVDGPTFSWMDDVSAWAPPFWYAAIGSAELFLALFLLGVAVFLWAARDILREVVAALRKPQDAVQTGRTHTLLYDADCGFCQQWVAWARERGPVAAEFRTCQSSPELRERANITAIDCSHAAYCVATDADGRVVAVARGAGAIHCILARVAGGRAAPFWRLVGNVYRLEPVKPVEDLGYAWVARNRHRFGPQSCAVPEELPPR